MDPAEDNTKRPRLEVALEEAMQSGPAAGIPVESQVPTASQLLAHAEIDDDELLAMVAEEGLDVGCCYV
jgi:hypothetical protein